MKIPNAEHAIVDIRKLRDYCLNSEHASGKHKARLFAATLGMSLNDAEELRDILLQVVKTYPAQLGANNIHGQPYVIDFTLDWRGKQAMIRI